MRLRILSEADAGAYYQLRLRMTKDHPEAYGSSYEETLRQSAQDYAERFAKRSAENFVLGCFDDTTLLSVAGFYREQHPKTRHRGHIWGVYTVPEARRQGCARLVFVDLLTRLVGLEGLLDLKLAVTVGNHAAKHFYESVGFSRFATEPRYIQHEAIFYDIDWMLRDL